MDRKGLIEALSQRIPKGLATDLVDEFLQIRRDVSTSTLGRSAPGKFVETVVQLLQQLQTGSFERQPRVDEYLRALESGGGSLDDGLRMCGGRIARAMYALRNKRNISHKGRVDPNTADLRFLLAGAQWIVAELIRLTGALSMEEAGRLVEHVQIPIGGVVEDFGDRRIVVIRDLSTREELLVLLHSHYPDLVMGANLVSALDRRSPKTVRNSTSTLWQERLIEGSSKDGYRLTSPGVREAIRILEGRAA